MVDVAGDAFIKGCAQEREGESDDNERPAHQVTISDFHIGKFEVNQAQWKQ